MGSGSTLVACVHLERPCLGIEVDAGYFEVACNRLQHVVAEMVQQLPLNLPVPR